MHIAVVVSSLVGAAVILAWRIRETSRPITARKIVIPPLGMSTGFGMFAYAPTRIPLWWGLSAFLAGALVLAVPLTKTSQLTRHGDVILLRRSKAFLWILLGLVGVRLVARSYVEQYVNPLQTGALFFVLAFGMILRWRVLMFLQYRKLTRPVIPAADASG
jgi:membrane protein CcdC involved in cytochrome C biogenesis